MKLVFLLASGYGNDLSIDKKDGWKVTLIFRNFTDFGSTRILGRRESLMGECCEANTRPSLNTVHRYYRDCLGQGFSVSVKTCDLHCVPDQLFPREQWREI